MKVIADEGKIGIPVEPFPPYAPGYYDAWLRLALAYFTLGQLAARDSALAHAALLPEARDGRIEKLRRQMAEVLTGDPAANPWRGLKFPRVPGHFGPPWFLPLAGAYYRFLDVVR